MYKINRIITICISFWLIFNLALVIPQPKASAQTVLPIATIALLQTNQTADVSPRGTGEVVFDGVVSCEFNDATSVIVSLAATDTWNTATVTPESLQFSNDNPGDKYFQVSVDAPLYTSCNMVGMVAVTGQAVMYPTTLYGTVQPSEGVTGRIDIAPFYKFRLKINESFFDAEPGSLVRYNLSVINQGNARDVFSISIINQNELTYDGFDVTLSAKYLDISELQKDYVEIIVLIPSSGIKINDVYSIEIEVTSEGCSNTGEIPSLYETFKLRIPGSSHLPGGGGYTINEESKTGSSFLPGFELILVISCVLIVVLVNKRYMGKKRIIL